VVSLSRGRAIGLAIVFSMALQGAIAIAGTLSGGYFGAPVPYGDSGGITFSLLGGFVDFVWPIFLLDIAITAIPLYLCVRPFPFGRIGVLVAVILFGILTVCAPLLEIAWSGGAAGAYWAQAGVAATLAFLACGVLALVDRTRSGR
jgi:hypothetical protein